MAAMVCHSRASPGLILPGFTSGGTSSLGARLSPWARLSKGAPSLSAPLVQKRVCLSNGGPSHCAHEHTHSSQLRKQPSRAVQHRRHSQPSRACHQQQEQQQRQQQRQQSVQHCLPPLKNLQQSAQRRREPKPQQQDAAHQVAHPHLTRRQLALGALSLSTLPLVPPPGEVGQLAHAAEGGEKTTNLPLNELKDIIARDISVGQYFVTGQLTRSIYREDCKFKDPTNTTVGVGKYLAAIGILFDPEYSKHELLTIEETKTADGAPAVLATWKLGGYLKFPWRPRVVPFTGSTTYVFDSDGLVALHEETWAISPAAALLETFTPTFGPRQLL